MPQNWVSEALFRHLWMHQCPGALRRPGGGHRLRGQRLERDELRAAGDAGGGEGDAHAEIRHPGEHPHGLRLAAGIADLHGDDHGLPGPRRVGRDADLALGVRARPGRHARGTGGRAILRTPPINAPST